MVNLLKKHPQNYLLKKFFDGQEFPGNNYFKDITVTNIITQTNPDVTNIFHGNLHVEGILFANTFENTDESIQSRYLTLYEPNEIEKIEEQQPDIGQVSGGNLTFNLTNIPIKPYSVFIYIDKDHEIIENRKLVTDIGPSDQNPDIGNLSDGGTINYSTGEIVLDQLSEPLQTISVKYVHYIDFATELEEGLFNNVPSQGIVINRGSDPSWDKKFIWDEKPQNNGTNFFSFVNNQENEPEYVFFKFNELSPLYPQFDNLFLSSVNDDTFQGNLTVSQDLNIDGNLNTSGDSTLDGNVYLNFYEDEYQVEIVDGDVTFKNNLQVQESTTLSNTEIYEVVIETTQTIEDTTTNTLTVNLDSNLTGGFVTNQNNVDDLFEVHHSLQTFSNDVTIDGKLTANGEIELPDNFVLNTGDTMTGELILNKSGEEIYQLEVNDESYFKSKTIFEDLVQDYQIDVKNKSIFRDDILLEGSKIEQENGVVQQELSDSILYNLTINNNLDVNGLITIYDNIIPNITQTYDIGSIDKKINNVYQENINVTEINPDSHNHNNLYYTETELNSSNGGSQVHWSNLTNIPSPTITLDGDITGTGSMTDLGDVSIIQTVKNDSHEHDSRYYKKSQLNTTGNEDDQIIQWDNLTNVPSPIITLDGNVTGTGTMTDLGDVTITQTVADNSHLHDVRYYTKDQLRLTGNVNDQIIQWGNLTNIPSPTITLDGDITGTGSMTDLGDVSIIQTVKNDSHEHDSRYYTKNNLQISGNSQVHWDNITNKSDPTIILTGDVTGSVELTDLSSGNFYIDQSIVNDSHTHDTRYYTEGEVDTFLAGKSNMGHNHDSSYYTKTELVNEKPLSEDGKIHFSNIIPITLPDTTITLTGDVSGSAIIRKFADVTITQTVDRDQHDHDNRYYTETELSSGTQNVHWNTITNRPDPVITLVGDVTGTGTMTDLGSVSITQTVDRDQHDHDNRYYTESEMNTFLQNKSDITHTHGYVEPGQLDNYVLKTGDIISGDIVPNQNNTINLGSDSFRYDNIYQNILDGKITNQIFQDVQENIYSEEKLEQGTICELVGGKLVKQNNPRQKKLFVVSENPQVHLQTGRINSIPIQLQGSVKVILTFDQKNKVKIGDEIVLDNNGVGKIKTDNDNNYYILGQVIETNKDKIVILLY